ncbi:MAG: DMT family transporter [Planctomycetes bacterium]|nr:DMT family transporter [Planctomycetota bacterium]
MLKRSQKAVDLSSALVLGGIVLSWSFGPLIVHQFMRAGVTVWDQNFYRYLVALAALWAAVKARDRWGGESDRIKLTGRLWLMALVPTAASLGLQVTFAWSLYKLEPGMVGLLHKHYIIWAVCLAMIFFPKERVLLRQERFWRGFLCTLAGAIGVVLFKQGIGFEGNVFGIVLVVLFAICTAFFGIGIGYFVPHVTALHALAMVATYNTIGLGLLAFIFGDPGYVFTKAPSYIWWLIIFSGMINIGLSHLGFYWVVPRVGVTVSQTVLMGTAFLTPLLSWVFFSEEIGLWQWLSGGVLVYGAALTLGVERDVGETK